MALTAQPMPSPNMHSAFPPYSDVPESPGPHTQSSAFGLVQRMSNPMDTDSLVPPSPYPATIDPSPVDSNNSTSTDATDFEVEEDLRSDGRHGTAADDLLSPASNEEIVSPASSLEPISPPPSCSRAFNVVPLNGNIKVDVGGVFGMKDNSPIPGKLNTHLPPRAMGNAEDGPASVIHIPSGFKSFTRKSPPPSSSLRTVTTTSPSETSSETLSPNTPDKDNLAERRSVAHHTSPINTSIPPENTTSYGQTPRASTRQEADEEYKRKARLSKSLEDIAEAEDGERAEDDEEYHEVEEDGLDDDHGTSMSSALESLNNVQEEISTLKNALSECWTLCNTLAGLSSNHRERMFSFANSGDMQEQAWRSCWRLCQNLYESRDEDVTKQIAQTLELCRDFCMALFDARLRTDEALDSVLRVSFELNNHLYNTHDRNLPVVFQERTLDFYITMCHRLMKQRTSLPEETDSLLRACWSLAEMLFSLRQNNRDNKPPDEELLGSAVQACWELSDLFREGWSQVRPERGTPRPVTSRAFDRHYALDRAASVAGSSVSYAAQQMLPPSRPTSSMSVHHNSLSAQIKQYPPETPTTLFDETADSPATDPAVPNIMVLGPYSERNSPPQPRHWSSSASQSSYRSESSTRTSSTATGAGLGRVVGGGSGAYASTDHTKEPYLPRLKALILKAAMNTGYNRASPQPLQSFVKGMPANAFGIQPWQLHVVEQYRRLVLADPSFRPGAGLPSGRKTAAELARAVQWLAKNESFGWMRDLFRVVFGFAPEDAPGKTKVWIQT